MPAKKDMRKADGWNDKEKLFAYEYLIDQNKTQAAIRAGYSAKTASVIGFEIYNRAHVKEWIEAQLAERTEKIGITAERVLQEVAKMAFMDPRKFFNDDGSIKAISSLDDHTAMCLAGLEITTRRDDSDTEHVLTKLKLTSKKDNLELLGRNLKMWTDKVEINERPKVFVRDLTGKKD
jgi:phage terminase small subunit